MTVDLGVDVQHEDPAHALGILLHHLMILRVDILLPLLVIKVLLGLNVVGVGLEAPLHVALLGLGLRGSHGPRDSTAHHFFAPQLDPGLPRTGRSDLGGQGWVVIVQFLDEVGMVGAVFGLHIFKICEIHIYVLDRM